MSGARRIGIVGLGLLGSALAQRLLGAGYAVLGFDIDRKRQPALEKMGGTFAASLPELAHRCHTMFLAVFDTEQVEAVVEGTLLSAIELELWQDRPLRQHVRSGPDRRPRRAHRTAGPRFAGNAHLRHE